MKDQLKDWVSDRLLAVRQVLFSKSDYISTGLTDVGYVVEPGIIGIEDCRKIASEIDSFLVSPEVKVWRDSSESDNRIYGFERISKRFYQIFDLERIRKIGENYLGQRLTGYFVLAARLDYKEDNVGSGGGWHRDSAFSHQFKAIVYLSSVKSENGPFEYVEGSHMSKSKLDMFSGRPSGSTRYRDEELKHLEDKKTTITGNPGDVIFVDTRGVHRGRPIDSGERYALTFYFLTHRPNEKISALLQSGVTYF